jgi:4-amino-4-deoxy-L-arabinose transferase-like glycosyltransferase
VDANGYWAQGSLLRQTGHTWFRPENDLQYIGMHWLVTEDGRYFSRYPPGLAVPIALAYGACGPLAYRLFDPLLATLALLGTFLLLRKFVGPWYPLAGVLLLAINPIFNLHAQYHYAHMAAACLLVWGLLFLVRWARNGALKEIFLAGLIFGCVPTVRYPEATFALGVGGAGAGAANRFSAS